MKNIFYQVLIASIVMLSFRTYAQHDTKHLGQIAEFKAQLRQQMNTKGPASLKSGNPTLSSPIPGNPPLLIEAYYLKDEGHHLKAAGKVLGKSQSNFYIHANNQQLSGHIILEDEAIAYTYTTQADGAVYIEKTDIHEVLCIGMPAPKGQPNITGQAAPVNYAAVNNLQSLPGAEACIYLDYDGYYLPAGSRWYNGQPLHCAPAALSTAEIQESWEIVSEDMRPFNVNVTTNRAVYESYHYKRRQTVVFTPTKNVAPNAGGVAYMNSFGFIKDEACWVFASGGKGAGEAASHEVGHTIGLGHDGRNHPQEEYFGGHGNWAPIMGVGYYKPMTQWSRGEYAQANNHQDDFAVMANFIHLRNDDHGNNLSSATFINHNNAGQLETKHGVITARNDKDFFRFTCGTGPVTLDINTVHRHGNLNTHIDLYEGASGKIIGRFNGNGLHNHINAYLGVGTYFISVQGAGAGNPASDGYSDYGAVGSYTVNGRVTPGGGGQQGMVTLFEHCPYTGNTLELGVGRYTLSQLRDRGFVDNSISSLRIKPGYKAVLYEHDHYGGRSLNVTGDVACLTTHNFNDILTSIEISANTGSSTLIEAEHYFDMSGVETEPCTEGGLNVAYIDQGDWMAYQDVQFPSSGSYTIEYRVASDMNGGKLSADLNAGGIILGQLDIPNTGGWQNWATISHTVNVNAGTYPFGLYAVGGGWNINWIKVTALGNRARITDNSLSTQLKATIIYPNPTYNLLHIETAAPTHGQAYVIYNDLGQSVHKGKLTENVIDVSDLASGIYQLHLLDDATNTTHRFMKK